MFPGPLAERSPAASRRADSATIRAHDLRDLGPRPASERDDTPTAAAPAWSCGRSRSSPRSTPSRHRPGSTRDPARPGRRGVRPGTGADLATRPHLVFVCPRYEGVDDRVRALVDLELSIGDYVLTGGELPALVVIDAVMRLLPGAIDDASTAEESFVETACSSTRSTRGRLRFAVSMCPGSCLRRSRRGCSLAPRAGGRTDAREPTRPLAPRRGRIARRVAPGPRPGLHPMHEWSPARVATGSTLGRRPLFFDRDKHESGANDASDLADGQAPCITCTKPVGHRPSMRLMQALAGSAPARPAGRGPRAILPHRSPLRGHPERPPCSFGCRQSKEPPRERARRIVRISRTTCRSRHG